jgi:hypothetical protein
MKGRLTWVNLTLGLAVVALAAILVWRQPQPDAERATPQRNTSNATSKPDGGTLSPEPQPDIDLGDIDLGESATPQRDGAASQADDYGMSLEPPDTLATINDVDPLTGKPIGPKSPTLVYKGHTIGFCCAKSSGYTGGRDRMSEAEKDAVVARFVK